MPTPGADGTIAYNAGNLNLQHLAAGVAFTDSFSYTVRMANGAYSTAVATLQLMGTNDAPTLALIAAATINDTAADDTPAAVTGTRVATVTDEHGASASRTMEFTLVGANDTAVFGGVAAGSVTEDGPLTAGDIVTVADRDHDQSAFQAAAGLSGDHGSFTFAELSGAWGYSLNNADSAVQGLWAGETTSDTLTVTSIDGGAQDIVVTIHGADDAAVFGAVTTGGVTEDGTLSAGGTVTVSDLDHDQAGFQAATLAELTGDHGTFSFTNKVGVPLFHCFLFHCFPRPGRLPGRHPGRVDRRPRHLQLHEQSGCPFVSHKVGVRTKWVSLCFPQSGCPFVSHLFPT